MTDYYEQLENIGFEIVENGITLTKEQAVAKEAMWQDLKKKSPGIFNGGVWSCVEVNDDTTKTVFRITKSDYSTITFNRINNLLGRSMGTGILIFQGDHLVLGRRPTNLVTDPGKLSIVGGVLDTNLEAESANFWRIIEKGARVELEEEVETSRPSQLYTLGIAVGEGLKLEAGFVIFVDDIKIKDANESTELIRVPKQGITDLLVGDKLELSTRLHLEHWAKKIVESKDGKFWK